LPNLIIPYFDFMRWIRSVGAFFFSCGSDIGSFWCGNESRELAGDGTFW
jgi:hypothetical protein